MYVDKKGLVLIISSCPRVYISKQFFVSDTMYFIKEVLFYCSIIHSFSQFRGKYFPPFTLMELLLKKKFCSFLLPLGLLLAPKISWTRLETVASIQSRRLNNGKITDSQISTVLTKFSFIFLHLFSSVRVGNFKRSVYKT